MTRHPLDLPFEEDPQPGKVTIDSHVTASVVVLASVVDTALGPWPALVFRFTSATAAAIEAARKAGRS